MNGSMVRYADLLHEKAKKSIISGKKNNYNRRSKYSAENILKNY